MSLLSRGLTPPKPRPPAHLRILNPKSMNAMEPARCISVDDAVFALFQENLSEACKSPEPRDAHQTWTTDKVLPSIAIDSLLFAGGMEDGTEQMDLLETPSNTVHTTSSRTWDETSSSECQDSPSAPSLEMMTDEKTETTNKQRTENKKLRAWSPQEHERFVVALTMLRTEKTEAVRKDGERSVGLGPGIAEMIASMVGTRNA
eukprot:418125-Rhodomonas_salina.1